MASKKLKFHAKTDMFGTNLFVTDLENTDHAIGKQLEFNPLGSMSKRLAVGYLFRSPKLNIEDLDEIWQTIATLTDKYMVWVVQDEKSKDFIGYAKFADKHDATMFAFAHSLFEKWSDEKEKEAKKSARTEKPKLKVNKDGSIQVRVTTTTLDDE